jgi:enamine deaminase RidA (YjgF/YER057c/UK114 family)
MVDPGGPAGSSSSTTPSSAATRTAVAVRSFVTEAQRKTWFGSPTLATVWVPATMPAAAFAAPQVPTASSAATAAAILRAVERRLVSSGSPYERVVGFSRAVRVGERVLVAGTAPVMPEGADPPPDAYGQAKRCLAIIEQALAEAGGTLAHVVRTRVYLVRTADFEAVGRAHGEAFSEIRPANTTLTVSELVDPRWLVEIEAEAVITDTKGEPQ